MSISVFDMFSIGIGPSSSHTVGPMRAAYAFVQQLHDSGLLNQLVRIQIDVYGSLALTGKGHSTDVAIINGLQGQTPEAIHPASARPAMDDVFATNILKVNGTHAIDSERKQ